MPRSRTSASRSSALAVRQLHVRDDDQRRQLVVEQRARAPGQIGDQHHLPVAAAKVPRQLGTEQRLVLDQQQRVRHTHAFRSRVSVDSQGPAWEPWCDAAMKTPILNLSGPDRAAPRW